MFKKLILAAMALALMISCVSIVSAEGTEIAGGKVNNRITWSLDDQGKLTITGTGAMPDYKYEQTPWAAYQNQILTVEIGDGITSVGKNSFRDCAMLTSAFLPEGLTKISQYGFSHCDRLAQVWLPSTLKTLEANTFDYCYSLVSIDLPDGLQTIGGSAFHMSTGLREIVIPDSVTSIGGSAFAQCDGLVRAVLPKGLKELPSSLFFDADALEEVILPEAPTSIVHAAFGSCDSLKSFTLPASVEVMEPGVWSGCAVLEGVEVEAGNEHFISIDGAVYSKDGKLLYYCPSTKTGVFTIEEGTQVILENAFGYCDKLTDIRFPDTVTEIQDYAFRDCVGLTEITLGNGVETVGEYAFSACENLTILTFGPNVKRIDRNLCYVSPGSPIEHVYFTGDAPEFDERTFYRMSASVYYPAGNETWNDDIFKTDKGEIQTYGGNDITWKPYDVNTMTADGTLDGGISWQLDESGKLTISGTGAMPDFEGTAPWHDYCREITSVDISEGITSIGAYSFAGCQRLADVKVSGSVKTIGVGAFSRCSSLQQIEIPSSVTAIGEGGFYKSGLVSITIPDSVTEIGDTCFYQCAALRQVRLSAGMSGISTDMLGDCDALEEVYIPEGITSIGEMALYDCDALEEITLPASLETYADAAISNCGSLVEIHVASGNQNFESVDGVLYSKDGTVLHCYPAGRAGKYTISEGTKTIDYAAFAGSDGLSGISLPKSLEEIGPYAFVYCGNLPEVTVGDQVHTVGEYAFYGCNKLVKIHLGSGLKEIGANVFYITNHKRDIKEIFFTGDAPTLQEKTFYITYASIYYPEDNETWTDEVRDTYTFNGIVWIPYTPEEETAIPGDIDGNETVDVDDVLALLWYVLFPDDYPIEAKADFDGNGSTDVDDVLTLLWYVLFPDDYPLN